MRKKIHSLLIPILLLLAYYTTEAQSIEGSWEGTSLCQVKNSPCHDEVVVYHVSRDSSGKAYEMIANKIVNGKEDYMGTLVFVYEVPKKVYASVDSARAVRWEFTVSGNTMKGTLIYKGALYRVIEVTRKR